MPYVNRFKNLDEYIEQLDIVIKNSPKSKHTTQACMKGLLYVYVAKLFGKFIPQGLFGGDLQEGRFI